jgi:hypothetical protein
MVIRIVNEELFNSLECEVNFPTPDSIQIEYSDGERRERLVAIGRHKEDDFLTTFGFKIIAQ